MKNNIYAWPNVAGRADAPLPKPITRPCDWGLLRAVSGLEAQLGTIEAYNRLATASAKLKDKIAAGNAEPQNPFFAANVGEVK